MSSIIERLIERKRAVFLILVMLYIWGIKSYINIPKEDEPSVQIPIVIVAISQGNISPEDGERLLIKPIETSLKSISNVKKIESKSYFGGGHVLIHFKSEVGIKDAIADVRDKINKIKGQFPKDAREPEVIEINLSEGNVLSISLFGDTSETVLSNMAKDLADKIKEIPSVLEAKVIGNRAEEGQITINPKEILVRELNLAHILQAVRSNNELQPVGKYNSNSGRHGVTVNSVIGNIDDLKNIPVLTVDKYVLKLGDIADIRLGQAEEVQVAKVNGRRIVAVDVKKKSGANIIKTIEAVKKVVESEKQNWPQNISFNYSNDNSEEIRESILSLENTVILTIILSIIPIYFAMGLRSALLVAFSIPTSFLFGVMTIDMLGYTMNVVVIFSLILSVGMLVDATVVVCEYADCRMKEGMVPMKAYLEAAKKMWWPVFSSTVTTLIVYLPLFVWPGVIGKFMYFLPLTIMATVSGSLIVAYSFVPVIGSCISSVKQNINKSKFDIFQQRFSDKYEYFLNKVLDRPGKFVSLIFLLLILVIVSFGIFGAGFEFFPQAEPRIINIEVKSKDALSIKQIEKTVSEIEDKLKAQFPDEISIIYSHLQTEGGSDPATIAWISLQLSHWKDRRKGVEIVDDIRKSMADIYGAKITVSAQKNGPPGASLIMLNITSNDPSLLDGAYKKVRLLFDQSPNFIDIKSDYDDKQFEWEIQIDKEKAAKYGVDSTLLANFIQMVTGSLKITSYRPSHLSREVDIIAKFPDEYRSLEQMKNLTVIGKFGKVSIRNFMRMVPVSKVKTLSRTNGQRSITINASIQQDVVLDNEVIALTKQIKSLSLDSKISVNFAGEQEDMDETGNFLKNAFILALVSMFLVMLIQFNSYYETVVIMTAVFLSTTGVLLGLLITARPFGVVMCGLGIIALAGVVVNNNIIFIDCYKDYLKNGKMSCRKALIKTGRDRIRPILLTAITAVLGLLPMVIGFDIDFLAIELNIDPPSGRWWAQLSTTICGGLAFATILTLFFTPALLMLESKIKSKILNFVGYIYEKINITN